MFVGFWTARDAFFACRWSGRIPELLVVFWGSWASGGSGGARYPVCSSAMNVEGIYLSFKAAVPFFPEKCAWFFLDPINLGSSLQVPGISKLSAWTKFLTRTELLQKHVAPNAWRFPLAPSLCGILLDLPSVVTRILNILAVTGPN